MNQPMTDCRNIYHYFLVSAQANVLHQRSTAPELAS